MQTHKQITFRNQNVAGYIKNLISSLDRQVSRRYRDLQIQLFLSSSWVISHIFNVNTYNDHLELIWIYSNTSKVCFVIGCANYIKYEPNNDLSKQSHSVTKQVSFHWNIRREILEPPATFISTKLISIKIWMVTLPDSNSNETSTPYKWEKDD